MKDTEEKAAVMEIEAQSALQAKKATNTALILEGRSEQKNIAAFEAQRKHEFEMRKAQVFNDLASKSSKIVMSGKSAGEMMKNIFDVKDPRSA